MKIFLLRPALGHEGEFDDYDQCDGFVVQADDEAQARELAAGEAWDEGRDAWLSRLASTCVELVDDGGAAHVVMKDTHPG